MLLDAALAGLGIVNPARAGTLKALRAGHAAAGAGGVPRPVQLWLYYASADLPPRLGDFLLEHFRDGRRAIDDCSACARSFRFPCSTSKEFANIYI